jgi:hypothetical protein
LGTAKEEKEKNIIIMVNAQAEQMGEFTNPSSQRGRHAMQSCPMNMGSLTCPSSPWQT